MLYPNTLNITNLCILFINVYIKVEKLNEAYNEVN